MAVPEARVARALACTESRLRQGPAPRSAGTCWPLRDRSRTSPTRAGPPRLGAQNTRSPAGGYQDRRDDHHMAGKTPHQAAAGQPPEHHAGEKKAHRLGGVRLCASRGWSGSWRSRRSCRTPRTRPETARSSTPSRGLAAARARPAAPPECAADSAGSAAEPAAWVEPAAYPRPSRTGRASGRPRAGDEGGQRHHAERPSPAAGQMRRPAHKSGAAAPMSDAVMFASDSATARSFAVRSDSRDGTVTRISEPTSPMRNAAPIVNRPSGWRQQRHAQTDAKGAQPERAPAPPA